MGPVLADHAARPHRRALGSRSRRGQTCVRSDDDDAKDRHRRDRSRGARLTVTGRRYGQAERYPLLAEAESGAMVPRPVPGSTDYEYRPGKPVYFDEENGMSNNVMYARRGALIIAV